ncbi:Adenylate cyclase type 10 [Irineochytrium annulatum]|nr:Adenylate cyclase type 10 [Irineochytrium annulatum]
MSIANALQLVPQALRRDILGGVCQEWPSVETLPNAVVALIDISGGSVIKFAGDAALVCWGEPESDFVLEVLRATSCCVELLAAMKGYQVEIGSGNGDGGTTSYPLKIHVGIGVGPLHRVHIGDPTLEMTSSGKGEQRPLPRREFFVAGQAVVNAGEMEGRAARGEIAIAPAARSALYEILGDDYTLMAQPPDVPIVIPEGHDLSRLIRTLQSAYVLRHQTWEELGSEAVLTDKPKFMSRDFTRVLTYVDESLAYYLSTSSAVSTAVSNLSLNGQHIQGRELFESNSGVDQLRNVSVIFIRFTGLSVANLNESRTLNMTQKIFMMIVGVLRRYKGCLRQFACDDKAASALIVFGLSGFAHERGEEVAAMRAAWDIRDKLIQLVGSKFGIGVTSGIVLYGLVGNENRADATCLGATVNLAARFMTHHLSAGRILCDESIRGKSADAFVFEELGKLSLKGFAPLHVFTPAQRSYQKAGGEVELGEIYGRSSEMDLLVGCC